MLFLLLLLADAETRVVYVSSVAIDPAIVDYYLRFLPDPDDARARLALVDAGDPAIGSLSAKLLRDPSALDRLRAAVGSPPDTPATRAYMLPFNVTPAESELAAALGIPLLGPRPDLVRLGSKSGSRQVAAAAGVRYLTGAEDLFSLKAVAAAIADVQAVRPEAEAVVVKLNNGFAGQGNAIIELGGLAEPLPASATVFCAPEESLGVVRGQDRGRGRHRGGAGPRRRPALAQRPAPDRGRRHDRPAVHPRPDPRAGRRTRCTSAAGSRPGPTTASPSSGRR